MIFYVTLAFLLVAGPAHSAASGSKHLDAQFFPNEGSKRVQISYGPYTAPPASQMSGMKSFFEKTVQMPCTDCLVTWMQADLEYANGTTANANTGLWLHHTVLANTAEESLTCKGGYGNVFASGNERTPIDICANGTDEVGYYISPDANFAMETDLMNMVDLAAEANVLITYEYIPKPSPSFAHAKVLWLDIGGCNTSELPAKMNATFQYSSPEWKATAAGRVTFIGAHIHDGGTHIQVKNNDQIVCDSVAAYGGNAAYVSDMPMNMTMSNGQTMEMDMEVDHISSLGFCDNVGIMKPGDKWSVTAYYNTSEYTPMTDSDGSLEPIMGISLVYFVEDTYVNGTDGTKVLKNESPTEDKASSQTTKVQTNAGSAVSVSMLCCLAAGAVAIFI